MEMTKFRFVSALGEFEFEGSEEYVERNISKLDTFIKILTTSGIHKKQEIKKQQEIQTGNETFSDELNVPAIFGEWMNSFKAKDLTDLDKALITAFYIQKKSPTNEFKTNEITTALSDNGIKIANPSGTLKRLSDKKYMFQVRKDGKIIYKRVSDIGEKKLKELLTT